MSDAAVMYLCGASEDACRASQLPRSVQSLLFDANLYNRPGTSEAARGVLQVMHKARACIWTNAIMYNAESRSFTTVLHRGRGEHELLAYVDPEVLKEWSRSCTNSMVAIALDVYWEDKAHANMLLIDKARRQIEHFEPHGEQIVGMDDTVNAIFREDVQRLMNAAGFADYRYLAPVHICPMFAVYAGPGGNLTRLGVQTFLSTYRPKSHMLGTCAVWSLWYMHIRLLNPTDAPDEALRKAMSMATNLADATTTDRTTSRCMQWLAKNEQACDDNFEPVMVTKYFHDKKIKTNTNSHSITIMSGKEKYGDAFFNNRVYKKL